MQITIYLSLTLCLLNQASAGIDGWSWQSPRYEYERQGTFVGTAPTCGGSCSDCTGATPYCWYQVKQGTGANCWSGHKVYCNSRPSPYSAYWPQWHGTAPYCGGGCGDCNGVTCLATDGCGDGSCCSNEFGRSVKAACVAYASRRRLEELANASAVEVVDDIYKGVDIGFYIYLGDIFEDNQLFESNDTLVTDLISGVASALTNSVSGITTNAEAGSKRAHGYANETIIDLNDGAVLFPNASMVIYLNLQYIYETEEDAANVETYLDDTNNKDPFSDAVTTALGETGYGDLEYETVEAHFVEANIFVTATGTGTDGTSKSFTLCNLLAFQCLAILFSILKIT